MVASPYNKQIQKAIRAHGPVLASGGGQYQPPSGRIQVRATKRTGTKNHRKAKFATPQSKALSWNQPIQEPARVCNIVGGVISPLLSNGYLHYVFDLWVHWWRKNRCQGEVSCSVGYSIMLYRGTQPASTVLGMRWVASGYAS